MPVQGAVKGNQEPRFQPAFELPLGHREGQRLPTVDDAVL